MRLIDADKLEVDASFFNDELDRAERFYSEEQIKNAPTVDAVQGEKMSNQRVIDWIPIRERKPHLPGIYLVTARVFTGDILSTAAHFTPNGFLLDDVIAWAEMPAVWIDEQEQLSLF